MLEKLILMATIVIPRYFGTFRELDKFHARIAGEPVIIPADPESDLIMIYDVIEGEKLPKSTKAVRLVEINEVDKSQAIFYEKIYIKNNKLIKVLRSSGAGERVEVEDLNFANLTKVEGKPIIVPLPTRKKYRFAIFEVVNISDEDLREDVWKDMKTFIPVERWWFND